MSTPLETEKLGVAVAGVVAFVIFVLMTWHAQFPESFEEHVMSRVAMYQGVKDENAQLKASAKTLHAEMDELHTKMDELHAKLEKEKKKAGEFAHLKHVNKDSVLDEKLNAAIDQMYVMSDMQMNKMCAMKHTLFVSLQQTQDRIDAMPDEEKAQLNRVCTYEFQKRVKDEIKGELERSITNMNASDEEKEIMRDLYAKYYDIVIYIATAHFCKDNKFQYADFYEYIRRVVNGVCSEDDDSRKYIKNNIAYLVKKPLSFLKL